MQIPRKPTLARSMKSADILLTMQTGHLPSNIYKFLNHQEPQCLTCLMNCLDALTRTSFPIRLVIFNKTPHTIKVCFMALLSSTVTLCFVVFVLRSQAMYLFCLCHTENLE